MTDSMEIETTNLGLSITNCSQAIDTTIDDSQDRNSNGKFWGFNHGELKNIQ